MRDERAREEGMEEEEEDNIDLNTCKHILLSVIHFFFKKGGGGVLGLLGGKLLPGGNLDVCTNCPRKNLPIRSSSNLRYHLNAKHVAASTEVQNRCLKINTIIMTNPLIEKNNQ